MNKFKVTEKSHLQDPSNLAAVGFPSTLTNNIVTRRVFLGSCASLLAFLSLPRCARLPLSGTDGVRPLESSDTIFKLFRPLIGGRPLPRDEEALSLIYRWFKSVVLAKHRHEFPFDAGNVAQLSNLRRDTNGYFIKTYDTNFLQSVLKKAQNPTSNVKKFFPIDFSDVEPIFGNFYWLRQIRKRPKDKGSEQVALLGEITDLEAAEVYWLDIWVRVNNFVIPGFRVFWDSIGLIPSHEIGKGTNVLPDIASEESQTFIDFDRIVLTWHELAEEMGITRNMFYLKACFSGSDFDVLGAFPSGHPNYFGLVYQRQDITPPIPWDLSLDPSLSLAEQVDSWFIPPGFKAPIRNDLQALLHYLNVELLLRIDQRQDLAPVQNIPPNPNLSIWRAIIESYPRISTVPRPTLNDTSSEGQAIIYFLQQLVPSAEYLGNGMFAIEITNSGITASENGVRQSSWRLLVIAETAATAGGGATAGVAGVGAVITNKLVDELTERDEERDENLFWIDKYASEICVPISETAAECKECVLDSISLQDELDALKTQYTWESVGAAGAVGIACGVGAAVGALFFGIGAGPGCAIGALAGLLVSAAEAWNDHQEYKDAVRETKNTAFGPCDELPDITLGDPE